MYPVTVYTGVLCMYPGKPGILVYIDSRTANDVKTMWNTISQVPASPKMEWHRIYEVVVCEKLGLIKPYFK